MGNGNNRGIANTGKDTRGTSNRNRSAPKSVPPAAPSPIIIRVPIYAWSFEQEAIKRFETELRARVVNSSRLHNKLYACLIDFKRRSKANYIKLYFTIPMGGSWESVKRNAGDPQYSLDHIRIQNEFQIEEERRTKAQRHEDERREKEEEARATAARIAQEATRERERQAAEQKIKILAVKIATQTMYWESGTVVGIYVNSNFQIQYLPISQHQNHNIAAGHATSSLLQQQLKRALWDAYHSQGRVQTIYQISVPSEAADDTATTPEPSQPDTATENCLDLLDKNPQAYIECEKRKRLKNAEDVRQGTMKVTEPIATGLEYAALGPESLIPVGGILKIVSKVGGKIVSLAKPIIKKLSKALPDVVGAALRDPDLYHLFKTSLGKGPDAVQAAEDIKELGRIAAQHMRREARGVYKMHPEVSKAIWEMPEHMRGVFVEHALSHTQYQGWFRAGQLDRGFFPQIDFALTSRHPQMWASVKSVNPFARNYEMTLNEILPGHVDELVTGAYNSIKAGRSPGSIVLDVRLPPSSAVPKTDLLNTLRSRVPRDLQSLIKIRVEEF